MHISSTTNNNNGSDEEVVPFAHSSRNTEDSESESESEDMSEDMMDDSDEDELLFDSPPTTRGTGRVAAPTRTLLLKSQMRHQLSAIWAFLDARTIVRLTAEHCPRATAGDVALLVNTASIVLGFVPLHKTASEQEEFMTTLRIDSFASRITSTNREARAKEASAARAVMRKKLKMAQQLKLENEPKAMEEEPKVEPKEEPKEEEPKKKKMKMEPRIRTRVLCPKLGRQLSAIWAMLDPNAIVQLVAVHFPHFRVEDVVKFMGTVNTLLSFVPIEKTSGEQKKFLEDLDVGSYRVRIASCNRRATGPRCKKPVAAKVQA